MLADDLREKIKSIQPDVATIISFWQQSAGDTEYNKLHELTTQENFWQNPEQAQILKKFQKIKTQHEQYHQLLSTYKELTELIDLFEHDESELTKLKEDVGRFVKTIGRFKISLLLADPQDESNCFLSVNAGAGGTESQDWSEMLARMYVRFGQREGFDIKIVDYQVGEGAGIKSATLFVKGKNAFGLLKGEHGIHRLVRISPFDANKRRHTSFAGVFVMPEVSTEEVSIDPTELRIDTYRAGGAGGQHVNKTESAVRITHIPSGIVVQCQSERSQIQNRETAMKMLMAKLKQKQREEQQAKVAAIEKKAIEWGSQIRSYVLHPYKLVKDHRTDLENPQPDLVLDGDIMEFIEKYLIWVQRQQ